MKKIIGLCILILLGCKKDSSMKIHYDIGVGGKLIDYEIENGMVYGTLNINLISSHELDFTISLLNNYEDVSFIINDEREEKSQRKVFDRTCEDQNILYTYEVSFITEVHPGINDFIMILSHNVSNKNIDARTKGFRFQIINGPGKRNYNALQVYKEYETNFDLPMYFFQDKDIIPIMEETTIFPYREKATAKAAMEFPLVVKPLFSIPEDVQKDLPEQIPVAVLGLLNHEIIYKEYYQVTIDKISLIVPELSFRKPGNYKLTLFLAYYPYQDFEVLSGGERCRATGIVFDRSIALTVQ